MVRRIAPHTIVELRYELREGGASGTLLERMDESYPLKFYFGNGNLLPAFEQALDGLREGQSFSFTLSPSEGYGEINPADISEISTASLKNDPWVALDNLEKGDRMMFINPRTNREQIGTITEILSDSLLVDFNHAMAGKSLHFSGAVLYVRSPRQEEREQKRYIEPAGLRLKQSPQDE